MADPFIGLIMPMGFNFNPRGWFLCNGSLLPIASNTTLFSLLGTMYGGDGRVTFALPDLRGRSPMSKGRFPGSMYDWRQGQLGGEEAHTLTVLEMPSHAHAATFSPSGYGNISATLEATTDKGDSEGPTTGAYLAAVEEVGSGKDDNIYKLNPSPDSIVELGGFSIHATGGAGSVTVGVNGGGRSFNIIQPTLVVILLYGSSWYIST